MHSLRDWRADGLMMTAGASSNFSLYFHNYNDYSLLLSDRFGLWRLNIIFSEKQIILLKNRKKMVLTPEQFRSLLEENLGSNFPIKNLLFWIRGIPSQQYNRKNLPNEIIESGWKIRFLDYKYFNSTRLPSRLMIFTSSGRLLAVIKVKKWTW